MIVVTAGPDGTVTLAVPPRSEAHKLLGAFDAARRIGDGEYALPEAQLDAFTRHARRQDWVVTDRRGVAIYREKSNGIELGPLPECAHCGQSARRFDPVEPAKRIPHPQPKFCPECGQQWEPTIVKVTSQDLHATQICPTCGHTQRGAFPRCTACGGEIPPPEQLTIPQRPKLPEPVPVGETIGETLEQIHERQARATQEPWPNAVPEDA